jgi:N-acyl-D-aspartate/D-glutamate deacylase
MTTWRVTAGFLVVALVSAGVGFGIGFRQAWTLGSTVDSTGRGVAGLQLMRSIDAGRTHEVTYYFESQVDAGLMSWHSVQSSTLYPFLNQLSGVDVTPGMEPYVRQLAAYRKNNPSPLWDPRDMAKVEAYLRDHKPETAEDSIAASRAAKEAMDSVVSEYAP